MNNNTHINAGQFPMPAKNTTGKVKGHWNNYLIHLFGRLEHPYPLKWRNNIKHVTGAPVFRSSASGKKMWYGEGCPVCGKKHSAFRFHILTEGFKNKYLLACIACRGISLTNEKGGGGRDDNNNE